MKRSTIGGGKLLGLLMVLVMLALAGCSTLSAPRPTDPADPNQVAVDSAGDVGALGCAMIAIEGKPDDVMKAQLAAAAAQSVLSDPAPSFAKLQAALEQGMPPKYAGVAAVVLQRLKVRLGSADLIPADTVAWAMAESFISSCKSALGETA